MANTQLTNGTTDTTAQTVSGQPRPSTLTPQAQRPQAPLTAQQQANLDQRNAQRAQNRSDARTGAVLVSDRHETGDVPAMLFSTDHVARLLSPEELRYFNTAQTGGMVQQQELAGLVRLFTVGAGSKYGNTEPGVAFFYAPKDGSGSVDDLHVPVLTVQQTRELLRGENVRAAQPVCWLPNRYIGLDSQNRLIPDGMTFIVPQLKVAKCSIGGKTKSLDLGDMRVACPTRLWDLLVESQMPGTAGGLQPAGFVFRKVFGEDTSHVLFDQAAIDRFYAFSYIASTVGLMARIDLAAMAEELEAAEAAQAQGTSNPTTRVNQRAQQLFYGRTGRGGLRSLLRLGGVDEHGNRLYGPVYIAKCALDVEFLRKHRAEQQQAREALAGNGAGQETLADVSAAGRTLAKTRAQRKTATAASVAPSVTPVPEPIPAGGILAEDGDFGNDDGIPEDAF